MTLTYTPQKYICSCCGQAKVESEFYRESYTGARTGQCKGCINIKRRVQRGRAKHNKFVSKERCRSMDTVDYVLEDWRACMLHFGGACCYCGKPEGRAKKDKLDRDHLIPLSAGGKAIRENIVPACTRCNRGRGNRDWFKWFKEQSFYSVDRARKILAWQTQQL